MLSPSPRMMEGGYADGYPMMPDDGGQMMGGYGGPMPMPGMGMPGDMSVMVSARARRSSTSAHVTPVPGRAQGHRGGMMMMMPPHQQQMMVRPRPGRGGPLRGRGRAPLDPVSLADGWHDGAPDPLPAGHAAAVGHDGRGAHLRECEAVQPHPEAARRPRPAGGREQADQVSQGASARPAPVVAPRAHARARLLHGCSRSCTTRGTGTPCGAPGAPAAASCRRRSARR